MNTLKWLVRVAGWLSGCGCAVVVTACYGTPGPPQPHDPTVLLQDFSYTPASPIHVGETLIMQATLNKPMYTGWMQAVVKKPELAAAYLNDRGEAPDVTAGDGVYTGELEWTAALGTGVGLPVYAEQWADDTAGQRRDGPALTVLPQEEGGV
jgi:hypothetical protein